MYGTFVGFVGLQNVPQCKINMRNEHKACRSHNQNLNLDAK